MLYSFGYRQGPANRWNKAVAQGVMAIYITTCFRWWTSNSVRCSKLRRPVQLAWCTTFLNPGE